MAKKAASKRVTTTTTKKQKPDAISKKEPRIPQPLQTTEKVKLSPE